jgi:hypothetical protein
MGGANSLVGASETMSTEGADALDGVIYSSGYSVTSVSLASTSDASGSNAQTDQADYFQLGVTIGNDSIEVGFTVAGLGQVGAGDGVFGYSVGQGNEEDLLQIGASADGLYVGVAFGIFGLDAAQAQQVGAAFQEAISAPYQTGIQSPGSSFNYSENFGPGFSGGASATVDAGT